MDRYWENGSGYSDPTAKEVINNEQKRNKQVHDTLQEIKNLLKERDLVLLDRIKLKDKKTKKTYL